MTDEEYAEHRARWLTALDRIYEEIVELHHHREIWQFINDELPKHGSSSIVHTALTRWYVDAQAAAVRRLTERKAKVSFAGLLSSLRANAVLVTRDRFLAQWSQLTTPDGDRHGMFREMANGTFDSFAPGGGQHLEPAVVTIDLARLQHASRKVSRWADENVAHLGRKQSVSVTFSELDRALDELGELLTRYYLLLTAGSLANVAPTIQDNWKLPLQKAW